MAAATAGVVAAIVAIWYLVLIFAGAYGMHRILLWMEQRGWIYYWHKRGSGNAGNVLMPIQAIYQPEVNYVLEERARNEAEEDESGDPPFPEDAAYDVEQEGDK